MFSHVIEGNALLGLCDGEDLTRILGREKSLRHDIEQENRCDEERHGDAQRNHAMLQHPLQTLLISLQQVIEEFLQEHVEPAVPLIGVRAKKPAAQHRSKRKGDNARDEYCYGDHNSEFMEQATQDTPHEEHRYKHSNKRECH